jgi:hypothetical protein
MVKVLRRHRRRGRTCFCRSSCWHGCISYAAAAIVSVIFIYMCMVVSFYCAEFGSLMLGYCLHRVGCLGGVDLAVCFREDTAQGKD